MSPQTSWILQEEVVPRLKSAIPRVVRGVGAEDSEELVQDGTVMAAQLLIRCEQRGKHVTAGNIAFYTIQHLKSGRRSTGSSHTDTYATGTQLDGRTALHSFHEVVCESEGGSEIFELQDVISNDREDPSVQAARKIDWAVFLAGLTHVEKLVVEFLSAGKTLREVARKVGFSDSTMQTHRKRIAAKVLEFMGTEILRDIAVTPSWRIGLDCEREAQACHYDRRACVTSE